MSRQRTVQKIIFQMTPFTNKCEKKSRTKLPREKIEKKGSFLPVKILN
jgi:hypothetical protein